MRIGFDSLPLFGQAGISVYFKALLDKMLSLEPGNDYVFYLRRKQQPLQEIQQRLPNQIHWQKIHAPNRILEYFWTKHDWKLPRFICPFDKIDLFFANAYLVPATKACPIVATVYDLTPMIVEHYAKDREVFEGRMRGLVKKAQTIITISENTRQDVIRYFNVPPERIHAIPLAAHERFKPLDDQRAIAPLLQKYQLENKKYLLYVGNLGPHKNVPMLLKAFAELKDKELSGYKFVICGSKRWGDSVLEAAKDLGLNERVVITDYVSDEELVALYNGAFLFLYASLYEGFGIPVLEAMQCGVPVVTSNISSLPEIAGEAALLVDPNNLDEIKAAIQGVAADEGLWKDLREKGLKQAALFSWEKTAQKTMDVLKRTLNEGAGDLA